LIDDDEFNGTINYKVISSKIGVTIVVSDTDENLRAPSSPSVNALTYLLIINYWIGLVSPLLETD